MKDALVRVLQRNGTDRTCRKIQRDLLEGIGPRDYGGGQVPRATEQVSHWRPRGAGSQPKTGRLKGKEEPVLQFTSKGRKD